MVKKLSREQKAWATRKKNANVPHKISIGLEQALEHTKTYTPAPILTLCGQLEDAIMLLEVRISNSIAKINSLM